jgi:hypothetical protein
MRIAKQHFHHVLNNIIDTDICELSFESEQEKGEQITPPLKCFFFDNQQLSPGGN